MMKIFHRKSAILLVSFLLLTGCGSEAASRIQEDDIELIEPKGATVNYEVADYHDLYRNTTYAASVAPHLIKNYSLKESMKFSNYMVSPNQQITPGTPLISGDTKDIDEEIKRLNEEIDDMEVEHLSFVEEMTEKLDEPRKNKKFYYGLTIEYKDREPEFTLWGTKYQDTALLVKQLETQLEQTNALYELDHQHKLEELQKLQEKRQEKMLTADVSGTVFAMKDFQYGDSMPAYTSILAVGDPNQKEIMCDFIAKSDIKLAEDVYAFFHGKRYEVTYEPMSNQEFSRRAMAGEEFYSTFHLQDGQDELEMGDRGVITVLHKSRKNVLCIMKKSIQKDGGGYYVYVLKDEEPVRVQITTGMEDSVYVEVLSGISAGDKVLCNEILQKTAKTAKATWGSLKLELKSTAKIFFPEYTILRNPVKYADCYYQERNVEQYQAVKAGDVLATVRVSPVDNELKRKDQQITRYNERIADLQEELSKEKNIKKQNEIKRSIKKKEHEVEKLIKKKQELQSDFEVSEIKAPFDGIVIWTSENKMEDKLTYDTPLFRIAAYDQCFLQLMDDRHILQYGDPVTLRYKDNMNQEITATGTIVTPGVSTVNVRITDSYVMIQLPENLMEEVCSNTQWRQSTLGVEMEIELLDKVLVIPKKSVTMVLGQTYTKVVEDDGRVHYQSIITGGIGKDTYAVIEGLTEGTEVCYE